LKNAEWLITSSFFKSEARKTFLVAGSTAIKLCIKYLSECKHWKLNEENQITFAKMHFSMLEWNWSTE